MARLRTVYLHGRLGRLFGREHRLAIDSPAEALQALTVLHKGFEAELRRHSHYRVTRGGSRHGFRGKGIDLREDQLQLGLGDTNTVHIAPVAVAAGLDPISWVVIAVAAVVAVATIAMIPTIKPPSPNDREDERKSFIMDGPVNVTEQGHPHAVIYGRVLVGSVVGSGSIENTDLPYSAIPDGALSTPGFIGSPLGDDLVWSTAKGGKSGGGQQRTAQEDPNTLQSSAIVRILDILGEGEIGGLVDGLKSVFINGTPVQNPDDSYNFKGIVVEERVGTPDQDPLSTIVASEAGTEVGTLVSNGTPVVHTVTDADINRVRVTLGVNGFSRQDTTNGDLKATSVEIAIDLQSDGGGYTTVVSHTFDGKTTSEYDKDFVIDLPAGGAPWDIRVRRVTANNAGAEYTDDVYWRQYAEIIDARMIHPDTALIGLTADVRQFGSSVASRAYLVDGLLVEVPSNYNPVTRAYTGEWDGNFVRAWTDNPAWCFRDLALNPRYGLGRRLGASSINKWTLYAIAQYCDGLVDNGFGASEPRYRMNVCIRTQKEAQDLLAAMAAEFRTLTYWSMGELVLAQDAPADPSFLVGRTNTLEDRQPVYEGGDLDEMYSAFIVWWNDPEDMYKLAPEIIEDREMRARIGWKPKEVTGMGVIHRGQAARKGRWMRDDQRYASQRVRYGAGPDHAAAAPGRIAEVADNVLSNQRVSGRVASATTTQVTLDRPVVLAPATTYTLSVVLPDGTVESRTVNELAGTHTALDLSGGALPAAPVANAIWTLKSSAIAHRQFRVLSVDEIDELGVEVVGVLHDPNKYARVEDGLVLEPVEYTSLDGGSALVAPTDPTVLEFFKEVGDAVVPSALFSWKPPRDARVIGYQVQVRRPGTNNFEALGDVNTVSIEVVGLGPGSHTFRVRAIDALGRKGGWVELTEVIDGSATAVGDATSLTIVRDDETIQTYLTWVRPADEVRPIYYEVWYSASGGAFGGATLIKTTLETQTTVHATGKYWVRTRFMQEVSASPPTVTVTTSHIPHPSLSQTTGQILQAQIADNAINTAKLALGITAVEIVGSLPVTGNFDGRTVYLTTDKKIYKYNSTAAAFQSAGAGSFSELTGTITTTQIDDDAITTAKIAAGAITAAEIASDTITAGQIAAGAISTSELAAGAVNASKIAAGTITATEIAASTITGAKIAAGTIEAVNIASATITADKLAASTITVALTLGSSAKIVLDGPNNRIVVSD